MQMTYRVRWADVDANHHMRHSAYADYAADVRMAMFEQLGYPAERFVEMALGPVLFREETRYLRELHMGDPVRIDCRLGGMSPDGRKWRLVHVFFRERAGVEEVCARLTVEGSWIDMTSRRVTAPPAALLDALRAGLEPADDLQDPYPAPR